jgi:hypothetical protein
MNGATSDIRAAVANDLLEISTVRAAAEGSVNRTIEESDELILEQILQRIADVANADVTTSDMLREGRRENLSQDEAFTLFGAIDQWASVASYAVASVYAPQSPIPRGLAGWAAKIGETLRHIASILMKPLEWVAHALNASGWSIGASFPWGISVSLNWP